jgi:hypothetical protein
MDSMGWTNLLALHSPDITPPNFSLWGYVKDQVFSMNVGSVDELHARITNAVASVTSQMLEKMWCETEHHLDIL